jgi:hypothetical protein
MMDNVINLKRARQKHNRQKLDAADSVCQYGFKGLLHEMHRCNFPIDDSEFQQDLAIAFKFIHAAVSKQYGLESPFIDAIREFKSKHKL